MSTSITLTVSQDNVYEEVAKITSYTGAKKEDVLAYDRIFTTDEDRELLGNYWNECKTAICTNLKFFLVSESEESGIYTIQLAPSSDFEDVMVSSIQSNIVDFFIHSIAAKWFIVASPDDAAAHAASAADVLENAMKALYHKGKPVRPDYKTL